VRWPAAYYSVTSQRGRRLIDAVGIVRIGRESGASVHISTQGGSAKFWARSESLNLIEGERHGIPVTFDHIHTVVSKLSATDDPCLDPRWRANRSLPDCAIRPSVSLSRDQMDACQADSHWLGHVPGELFSSLTAGRPGLEGKTVFEILELGQLTLRDARPADPPAKKTSGAGAIYFGMCEDERALRHAACP